MRNRSSAFRVPPHGDWSYGRYANPGASFQENTATSIYGNTLVGSDGRIWEVPTYPRVGEYAIAPSASQMAVRRWTSDRDGEVTVFYDAMRLQNGGNGQIAGIYLNGAPLRSLNLSNGNNHFMGSIGVSVQVGDQLDFIVDAKGNQNSDWTHFSARIEDGPPHDNPGLVMHWTLDERSDMPIGAPNARPYNRRATAGDSTGMNNHGWFGGNLYSNDWQPGLIGNALNFAGGNQYVRTKPTDVADGASALTLSAWIRPDDKDNWDGILTNASGGFTGIALADYNSQGYLAPTFRVMNAANVTSTIDTPVGEWSHVVAVWESDELHRIYVNGELAANNDANAYAGLLDIDQVWTIGSDRFIGGRWFDGLIDDIGIWERALSEQEIGKIYAGGLVGIDQAHASMIPEPSTFTLAALGLLGLGLFGWRRRRKRNQV